MQMRYADDSPDLDRTVAETAYKQHSNRLLKISYMGLTTRKTSRGNLRKYFCFSNWKVANQGYGIIQHSIVRNRDSQCLKHSGYSNRNSWLSMWDGNI